MHVTRHPKSLRVEAHFAALAATRPNFDLAQSSQNTLASQTPPHGGQPPGELPRLSAKEKFKRAALNVGQQLSQSVHDGAALLTPGRPLPRPARSLASQSYEETTLFKPVDLPKPSEAFVKRLAESSFVKKTANGAASGGGVRAGAVLWAVAATASHEGQVRALTKEEEDAAAEEDAQEEEEESEEAQTMWGALFTFFPAMWSLISACAAELIEAGVCGYLAMAMVPFWMMLRSLASSVGIGAAPETGLIAPPSPPSQPPFFVTVQDNLWAYAAAHPIYYLCTAFGIGGAIGTFYLFLQDIVNYLDKQRAARRRRERAMQREQERGYVPLQDEAEADGDIEAGKGEDAADKGEDDDAPVVSSAELNAQLVRVESQCEELEMMAKYLRKVHTAEDMEQLKTLQGRREELQELVHGEETKAKEAVAATVGKKAPKRHHEHEEHGRHLEHYDGKHHEHHDRNHHEPHAKQHEHPDGKHHEQQPKHYEPTAKPHEPLGKHHDSSTKMHEPPPGKQPEPSGKHEPPGRKDRKGRLSKELDEQQYLDNANHAPAVARDEHNGSFVVKAGAKGKMAPLPPPEPAKKRGPSIIVVILKSAFMKMVLRTMGGVMAISIYFADIISDVQVLTLLWQTGNYVWSWMSVFLLVSQFLVVYLRVIPYLITTFGSDSAVTISFIWLGFPTGLFLLDFLMFLEPFGLLAVLPFPDWLRTFVPAYKATRIIAEVAIESLPQCILQAYIYTVVIKSVAAGTASESEAALYEFSSALPQSILISIVAMLKTWIELVMAARQAGLSVGAKAVQLWQVGAGLPLDALKKGAITTFACPYHLEEVETTPLLDALSKNASLVHLDMCKSGLDWITPQQSGATLIEKMHSTPAALGDLQTFVISKESGFHIPVGKIRGHDEALKALKASAFFTVNGPWREEIMIMGDLLRTNLNVATRWLSHMDQRQEDSAAEAAHKLVSDARKNRVKKEDWQTQVSKLMVEGMLRRGVLVTLVCAEVLRDVGFQPKELLAAGFMLSELRRGGYTAKEMRSDGIKAADLRSGGYSAGQLKSGSFPVAQLKAAG